MKDFILVLRAAVLSAYGIHLAVAQVKYLQLNVLEMF